WEVNDQRTEYTFHLRRTARWSDGTPVVAGDFVYAWLRVLEPKTAAQYATLLFVIDGAEPYWRARLGGSVSDNLPPRGVGVQAIDEHTLRVRLVSPCSYFLDLTSFITFAPVQGRCIERWSRPNANAPATEHLWTRPGNLICNGAFVLRKWEFKRGLWLE